MADEECKQAMCSGWPMPAHESERPQHAAERQVRDVLISNAYTKHAIANKDNPLWIAMIEAIGHTPMTEEQIHTAQEYIHLLGDV